VFNFNHSVYIILQMLECNYVEATGKYAKHPNWVEEDFADAPNCFDGSGIDIFKELSD
jgi:hypothetical protein